MNKTQQSQCIFLAYNETIMADMVFSISPLEGISLLYNPNTTDDSAPAGFGAQAISQIRVSWREEWWEESWAMPLLVGENAI